MAGAVRPLRFGKRGDFHTIVTARVNAYFSESGQGKRDPVAFYLKAAVLFTWLIASYVCLVCLEIQAWQALALSVSLGLALASFGFNVFHDAGHNAISEHPFVNGLASLTMNFSGASSYVWMQRHNNVHHAYPNIHEYDSDIDIGGLGRFSPHQPFRSVHRFQHYYLWPFYALYSLKWQFVDDFKPFLTGRFGKCKFVRPRGLDLCLFVLGKLVCVYLGLVLPLTRHSIAAVLVCWLIVYFVSSILFVIVVQLSHLVEETQASLLSLRQEENVIDDDWAMHQAKASCDFSKANRALSWFLGGLNFQVEHHLFPGLCHVHYAKIAGIVEQTCKEFGVPYNTHSSVAAGLRSHFHYLRRLAHPTAHQASYSPTS
jgi:linoleoyl-CoA desaturase